MKINIQKRTYKNYIIPILITILIGIIGVIATNYVNENRVSSITGNFTNLIINDGKGNTSITNISGVYFNNNKAFSRTADVVVCRGTSALDDLIKSFTCDVVCKSTDNSQVCSNKINNAFSLLDSGRNYKQRVLLKGNLTINSTIYVPSYTILQIDGSIIADINGFTNKSSPNNTMISSSPWQGNCNDIEIQGGIIDGNRKDMNYVTTATIPPYTYLIQMSNVNGVIINGVTGKNFNGDGFLIAYSNTKAIITNNFVKDGNGIGINPFWNNGQVIVESNVIDNLNGSAGEGIKSEGNQGQTIIAFNSINKTKGFGITSTSSILNRGEYNTLIIGNNINNINATCILTDGSYSNLTNFQISGNHLTNCGYAGIYLYNVSNGLVEGNQITDADLQQGGFSGIDVNINSSDISILNNKIKSSSTKTMNYGINIRDTSNNIKLKNNNVYNSGAISGINIANTDMVYADNYLYSTLPLCSYKLINANYTVYSGQGSNFGQISTNRVKGAQSFTAINNMTTVQFNRGTNGGTFVGTVNVTIQTDNSNAPSGTVLSNRLIPYQEWNKFVVGQVWNNIDLPTTLTVGSKYWIVFESTTSNDTNYPVLLINTASNNYAGNFSYYTSSWNTVAWQMNFKVLYNDASNPYSVFDNELIKTPFAVNACINGNWKGALFSY